MTDAEAVLRRYALYFTGALLLMFLLLGVDKGGGKISSFFEPLVALPALFFLFRRARELPRFDAWLILIIFLYAGYYLLTWTWGSQPENKLVDMFRPVFQALVAVAVIALACSGLDRGKLPRRLFLLLAVGGACLGLASIVSFYLYQGRPWSARLEPLGSASHSVTGLYYYALPALCGWLGAWYGRGVLRACCLASFLVLLVVFYLTYSRGPALGLIVALGLFLLWKSPRFALWCLLFGGSVIAVIWSLFGSKEWLARMDTGRFEIWESAFRKIPEAWLMGHGNNLTNYVNYNLEFGGHQHCHNIWISHAYWGGLFAVLLLAAAYGRAGVILWRQRHNSYLAELGLLLLGFGLVVLMPGGNILLTYPGAYWFVFVLPLGLALGVSPGNGYKPVSNALDSRPAGA